MDHARFLKQQAIQVCEGLEDLLNAEIRDDPQGLEEQRYAQQYAESWLDAKFKLRNWGLKSQLEQDINRHTVHLWQVSDNDAVLQIPGTKFDWEEAPPETLETNFELLGRIQASRLFFKFLTSQFFDRLGKCARAECGRYYIGTRKDPNKIYCSRACSTKQSAVDGTARRRREQYEEKLQRVKSAIFQWRPTKGHSDWKKWVAKKSGINQRFITQAITRGRLIDPSG